MKYQTSVTGLVVSALALVTLAGTARAAADEGFYGPVEGVGEVRYLWPSDPSRPDGKMVELVAEDRGIEVISTPLGQLPAHKTALRKTGFGIVAESAVYALPEADGSRAWIIETVTREAITAPTGRFDRTHFALPAITPPASHTNTLAFVESAFAPPTRRPVASTGPALSYSDDLAVVMISPLDHFLAAIESPVGREWRCGLEGLIEEVPAGTVHRVLVVSGHGINATFEKWGDLVRGWYEHPRQAPDADVAVSKLGYWTDNGAYYYYKAAPGMNEHETLLAVRDDARSRDIPYGYFQIDSWWYPKAVSNSLLGAFRGGSMVWEPIPEKFPEGLGVFQRQLGLPLVAHNRWYDEKSPYCERFQCVYGHGSKAPALPIEPAFWDEIMDNAVSYGVAVYEQDWLVTQMDLVPWLRQGLHNADEQWFDVMADKAAERGLTMQLCMAAPGFFLQQVKHKNVTHVRCSGDYQAGILKDYYWPHFHTTSMLAHAVGMWPFKDNFQSSAGQRTLRTERWAFEEALISNLSAGPVGPADKIGAADRELLMRTCREDGLLLKPDRPATPIDLMFVKNSKPWIVTTASNHELGTTVYLAAFNLWPLKMRDPSVSPAELGLTGDFVLYNWRTREVMPPASEIEFGRMPVNDGFYAALCPALENGMAVLGETGKFVTMSAERFPSASYDNGRVRIEIAGVPGETVTVSFYADSAPRVVSGAGPAAAVGGGLYEVSVVVPASGRTVIEVE